MSANFQKLENDGLIDTKSAYGRMEMTTAGQCPSNDQSLDKRRPMSSRCPKLNSEATSMPDEFSLSLEDVANVLTVSTRTVRRFVQRGQLSKHYKVVGKARELRFSEKEVIALRQDTTKSRQTTAGQNMDSARTGGQTFSGSIDIKDLFHRYETVLGQLGYFQAKADEVKQLTEKAESLTKTNQELVGKSDELSTSLEESKEETDQLKKSLEDLQKRSRLSTITLTILAVGIIIAGIIILGPSVLNAILNR
jgi:hypothetical protein